jgi:hypothetical protein
MFVKCGLTVKYTGLLISRFVTGRLHIRYGCSTRQVTQFLTAVQRDTRKNHRHYCVSVRQLAWLEALILLRAASLCIRYDNGVNLHQPELRKVKHHESEVILF